MDTTIRVVDITGSNGSWEEVNDYLSKGWVLLRIWVKTEQFSGDGDLNESTEIPHYILGWQRENEEPVYPPYSFARTWHNEWDSKTGRNTASGPTLEPGVVEQIGQ